MKDRIGLAMIEAAERDGLLKPGGTIVEPTSGNTGVGLAIAAALKGYRCIFVMPDKMSNEKIAMLRAYGAEVVITPTAVEHDSPESYYSVSSRLAEEIPGGFKPDQYSNMANPEAHYEMTGPEIWEQTGGELDALVVSVGTGGTISGVGRYFKERNPDVLIVGADPEGSVYTAEGEGDLHPYFVEGIGKDTWPDTMDPEGRRRVGPSLRPRHVPGRRGGSRARRACSPAARRARPSGRRCRSRGGSGPTRRCSRCSPTRAARTSRSSSTTSGCSSTASSSGSAPVPTVAELLRSKRVEEGDVPALVTISAHQKVSEAIDAMQRHSISQLPVVRDGELGSLADVIGSLQDRDLLDRVFKNADALHEDVATAMQPPLATVDAAARSTRSSTALTGRTNAVLVASDGRPVGVVTRSDLLEYLAHRR